MVQTLTCSRCAEVKPASEFNRRGGGFHSYCRVCQKQYDRDRYQSQAPEQRERCKVKRKRVAALNKAWLDEMKSRPCMDCNGTFPPVAMDFDHREGEKKLFDIGMAAPRCYAPATILAEIAKCDIVCSNCHRVRTHNRRVSRSVA